MPSIVRTVLSLVTVVTVFAAWSVTIHAQEVEATIDAPKELTLGEATEIAVTLQSGGEPVRDTVVTLYSDATFAGVSGEIEIGAGTTAVDGVAVIEYEPRRSGTQELRIEYEVPDDTGTGTASFDVSVVGNSQLHQSESGIQVPGLNVWLIIGVVGGVWVLLVTVAWRVYRIAREGETGPSSAARPLTRTGSGE